MIRWGILSTARIAQRIINGARYAENAEIVAVGSRDFARAQAFASEHSIPLAFGSYEELLGSAEVDAVYIPLPNSLHVEWSVRAMEAGKHVLCEKPLTRDPAAVDEAFDAAERFGRVLMEAFMWRFHPQTEDIVELVPEIGELRYVRAAFGFNNPDMGNVRWAAGLEGGALMDVGCYGVSALRLICGEPERVFGEQVLGGDHVDGRFVGTLRFAGDVLGSFDCGMDVHRRTGLEIVGTEGTLWVPQPWLAAPTPLIVLTRGDLEERFEPMPVDPYGRELEEMGRAIEHGEPVRLGRLESLGQARAIHALYRSAELGAAVAL